MYLLNPHVSSIAINDLNVFEIRQKLTAHLIWCIIYNYARKLVKHSKIDLFNQLKRLGSDYSQAINKNTLGVEQNISLDKSSQHPTQWSQPSYFQRSGTIERLDSHRRRLARSRRLLNKSAKGAG